MLDESNISIIINLVFQIYPSGKINGIKKKRLKVLGVILHCMDERNYKIKNYGKKCTLQKIYLECKILK